ncbi:MAG: hypothetical protein AAF846_17240 [Chloroflexota bacterium]
MAWTQPKTWSNEPLIAGDMNTHIRDNLNALKDPPSDVNIFDSSAFATSSTSFVDVDATYLSSTITTNGGDVLVVLCVPIRHTATSYVDLDITIDGTRQGGTNGIIRFRTLGSGFNDVVTLVYMLTNLSAGSHTIALQWKTASGIATMSSLGNGGFAAQWFVREVS